MLIRNRTAGDTRFFDNRVLEVLSMSHPAVNTAFWLGWSFVLGFWATQDRHGTIVYLAAFPATVLGWTLVEYWMHRKIFHLSFASPSAAERAYILHEHHHDFPDEPFRNMLPLPISLAIGSAFFLALAAAFGWRVGAGALSQLALVFAYYDLVHYLLHRRWFRLFPALKRHHMLHHFAERQPGGKGHNFGITTTLWDRIFATGYGGARDPRRGA